MKQMQDGKIPKTVAQWGFHRRRLKCKVEEDGLMYDR